MFKTFFLLEIKSAFKQPMLYIFFFLMALFVFGAVSSDNVQIGGAVGNVLRNAPHIITVYTTIMTIFGLLIATAFFNNAALRDYLSNFNEIIFSTPLSKAGYYFGRFFGALVLSTIPMLGVFFGVILGTYIAPMAGWTDPSRFGDFYLETFVNNYFLFILPNMFFAGAIIFAMANKWKSTVISFVGTMAIIIAYIVAGTLISDIDNETIGALADSFGIRTYMMHAKYFTPIEKNTISPSFTGLLLINRLIWIVIGFGVLALSYWSFSFQAKNKKAKKVKESKSETIPIFVLPKLNIQFNRRTEWIQFKSFFYTNFINIIKSVTFKILIIFAGIQFFVNLMFGFEYFGLQAYPLTYKIIDIIASSAELFVIIVLVFFSGELVWRDRDSKINEVIDATPHTSFISLLAKTLSLVSVATALHFLLIFGGIIHQLSQGYTRLELDVYLLDFLYGELPMYFVWSAVMISIQVILNNKYIGYFTSIAVVFVLSIILQIARVESNMLAIGSGPSIQYSDMNAFGPGLQGAIWFNIYWILFSILFLLVAGALWNRGMLTSLKNKFRTARMQMSKSYALTIITVMIVWVGVAGYVYYNTQVLNKYKTSKEEQTLTANYEKKYKKYENINLPKITDAKYFIDIFPYKRDVHLKAILELTNESDKAIDSICFTVDEDWNPDFKIPNSTLVLNDKEFGFLIFELNPALQANESVKIEIVTDFVTQGFENERGNTNVVNNGTFLNNFDVLPSLGYNKRFELSDKNTRRKFDLPPKERMPKLEENCTDHCMGNYLTMGTSDYINVETVISTAGDQIAVAPGSLLKKWTENGRNYFHYKVDHPSQNFYSFISARFEVAKRKWQDVDIEVYYDKKHGVNVERMMDAVQRSLTYYTKNFGPYMHKQCRIIEFPRYASFAQAFPGTMPYSESMGFIINLEDEDKNNIVDAVIAHEMAHQWWAHQVVGATMQGSTMFSESFAEYSSLMTMKNMTDNPMKMRKLLKYDHNRYLRGRSSEVSKELPLYKVENQGYIHYGKGSLILYALQDYIGEDKVNLAMRNFLNEFRYRKPPYPTSLDFMKHLEPQVPDSLQYLITDWFKEITLYDNRLKEASYKKLENGKYLVSLDIESRKLKADTIGNETQVAINDWIDIGIFADDDEERLMFEKRVKVNQEKMSFSFEVDSIPARAAIDPRHLLIDRVYKDNRKNISN